MASYFQNWALDILGQGSNTCKINYLCSVTVDGAVGVDLIT